MIKQCEIKYTRVIAAFAVLFTSRIYVQMHSLASTVRKKLPPTTQSAPGKRSRDESVLNRKWYFPKCKHRAMRLNRLGRVAPPRIVVGRVRGPTRVGGCWFLRYFNELGYSNIYANSEIMLRIFFSGGICVLFSVWFTRRSDWLYLLG